MSIILLAVSLALFVAALVAAWVEFGASLTKALEGIESLGRHPEGL